MARRVSLLLSFEVDGDVTDEQVHDLATDAYVQIEDPVTRDGGRLPGDVTRLDAYLVIDGTYAGGETHELATAVDALGDVEGWPQHLTCTEAEGLATILRAIGADELAEAVVLSHVEDDDDDAIVANHPGGEALAPAE